MAQSKTPAMVLQELCVKKHFPPPTYEIANSIVGTHLCKFDYTVTVNDIVVGLGTGSSKQISKHEAALHALKQLQELGIYDPIEMPVQEFKPLSQSTQSKVSPTSAPSTSSPFKSSPNCIGPLKELCFEYKIPEPEFKMISENGPPHFKEFTFECCVTSLKTVATSTTKKLAKQIAAQEMMEKVKNILPEIAAAVAKDEAKRDLPAISEMDSTVLTKYNETYGSIVANKTCKIEHYPFTLKNLMEAHFSKYEEFSEDIDRRNDDSLKIILDKLEVEYQYLQMQDKPPMVALIVKIDTPLTTIGIGSSMDSAKMDALSQVFDIMKCFMTSDMPSDYMN